MLRPLAAKNVILAGVRAVTVHDIKAVEITDLSANFYVSDKDVGKNRAEACREKLQELNSGVAVKASVTDLSDAFLKQFQVRDGRAYRAVRERTLRAKAACAMHLLPR